MKNYKYKISRIYHFLRVGMKVRSNGDGNSIITEANRTPPIIEGIINEVGSSSFNIKWRSPYLWHISNTNNMAEIEFLDEDDNIIPLTIKCSCCPREKIVETKEEIDVIYNTFKFIVKENKNNDWDIVCPVCYRTKFITCGNCGRAHKKEELKVIDNRYYCKKCYSQMFVTCHGCGELIIKNKIRIGNDSLSYCLECFNLRFMQCEICQRWNFIENILHNEEFGTNHCRGCSPYKDIILNYNYQPNKWKFHKMEWETSPLFMGVELEVEPIKKDVDINKLGYTFKNLLKTYTLENFFYLKTDSSIEGYEIVSHPFSLAYAHKNIKWNEILNWLISKGYTSYENSRCGLHIHLDKEFYLENDIAKMRAFFSLNKNTIEKFSRREGSGTNFCLYESFDKKTFTEGYQHGRHWAININTGMNTVEIRVFRGTLSHNRLWASLQFCDAVSNFVKNHGTSYFFSYKATGDMWKYFLEWCKKDNKYNHFLQYLKQPKEDEK